MSPLYAPHLQERVFPYKEMAVWLYADFMQILDKCVTVRTNLASVQVSKL